MKMKRLPLVLILGSLVICLFLTGCGGGGGVGGGSEATIRGQVVINGEPVGSDQVLHTVFANGKSYMGTVISKNGYFSHGSGSMDHEYCYPGCTVTLIFTTSDTRTFRETHVHEYVVKKGDNNLGQIDLGLYGWSLVSPEEGVEVRPEAWPCTFEWTPYGRPGITPEYRLNLNIPTFFGPIPIVKTTPETSVNLEGDEKVTILGENYGLNYATSWSLCVEYQKGNHTIRHYSDTGKFVVPNQSEE